MYNTNTVLRVQRKVTGKGMYTWDPVPWLSNNPKMGTRHPTPLSDSLLRGSWEALGLGGERYKYLFGFESEEQMRRWLYEDVVWLELEERGFEVVAFEVSAEQVLVGYTQVVFHREYAKAVRYMPCSSFLTK